MAFETILVEKKDMTTVITLNRPEKLNAMNDQMLEEIDQVLAELRRDTTTRFVILTGAGRAFSAGADQGARVAGPPATKQDVAQEDKLLQKARQENVGQMAAHDRIRSYLNLEQVTIAAVNGYCLGAGLVFAMESDFIIAAEDALLGVPKDKLMDAAWEQVDKIAGKAPLATRLTKKLVNAYTASGQGDLFVVEPELVGHLYVSGDPQEGSRAFREKRPPEFSE